MYQNIELKHTLDDIVALADGNTIALHGGRFISWVIANELDKYVDEIIISDVDEWVLKNSVTKTPKIKRKIRIIIRALSRTNSPCSGSASNTCKGNFFFPCYPSPYLCVFDYHFWYEHKYPHPKTSKPVSG